MIPRWLLPLFFILLIVITLPVNAHVPISADSNNDLTTALSVEKPTKSYVIYGHLHDAGDVGYYRFNLNAGDQLKISLMTTGFDAPVPDLVVMSPGAAGNIGDLSLPVAVPLGYTAEVIKGQKPVTAEYEPFSPAAIFNAASYSKNITQPGTYYVAVISPAMKPSTVLLLVILRSSVFRNGCLCQSIPLVPISGKVSPSSQYSPKKIGCRWES